MPAEHPPKLESFEKKKSKVASLRSKFSLKDIGREFRKEIPPLSSMPKLGGGSSSELKRSSSDGEDQDKFVHNFNEAKLYISKTRRGDVHPNSAPPHTSEFQDGTNLDEKSIESVLSAPSMQTPTNISEDGKAGSQFKHSLVHNTEVGQSTPSKRLETLLLDGSSPPARTGECKNSGQPELIQVQDRVFSMKAEHPESLVPRSPQTPPPIPSEAAIYSPSVYETPKKVAKKASKSSLHEKKDKMKITHPLIVSSADNHEKTREQQAVDEQRFMEPRIPPPPPLLPTKSRARGEVKRNPSIIVDEGQSFAGVTSHGGYAPTPPHPGYQNTITLEQQLASHVDSLHHHFSAAVNRIARTFENGNNWSIDQILKQVDSMFDLLRVTNARAATQAEMMQELSRSIMVKEEVIMLEIAKLRSDIGELLLPAAGPSSARFQAQSEKRFQNRNNHTSRFPKKHDDLSIADAFNNMKPVPESTEESKFLPEPKTETTAGKEPREKSPSENVPTPTAAYRTPKPQIDGVATPAPTKQEVSGNAAERSSGSPKPKADKLDISAPIPIPVPKAGESSKRKSLESTHPPTPNRESARKPRHVFSSDDLRTPKKKGGKFSFRRKPEGDHQSGNRFQILTPRRSKEGKSVNSQDSQSSRLPLSSPSKARSTPFSARSLAASSSNDATTTTGAGAQVRREESPSLVHPALRTPQQKKVMADRDRRVAHPNPHTQGVGHSHPLRSSQSHQEFGIGHDSTSTSGSPSFVSYDVRDPSLASGVSISTSLSSFRETNNYQGGMHYPYPSGPSPLYQTHGAGVSERQNPISNPVHPQPLVSGPRPGHGHGPASAPNGSVGQFDGLEWYGNGNSQVKQPVFTADNYF